MNLSRNHAAAFRRAAAIDAATLSKARIEIGRLAETGASSHEATRSLRHLFEQAPATSPAPASSALSHGIGTGGIAPTRLPILKISATQ